MLRGLRHRGLIPAFIVSAVIAAAVTVPVLSAGAHLFVASAYCSGVSMTAAPLAPQPSGTPVVFTASSTCPNAGQMYEFWLRSSTSGWILAQSYSTNNVFNWDSTGAPTDTIFFGVWVKDATSTTTTFDSNFSMSYVITSPCASVALAALPTSVAQGVHSTLTATATGCANTGPLFEFWLRTATSPWIMIQAFSTTATYDWNSTGAPAGTVYFGIWLKDAKSRTSTFDANNSTTVTVTAAVCTTVTIMAAPTSVTGGAHSTITAAASGCTNSTGQLYEFWLRTSTSAWIMVQGFSTTATYDWNSAGAPTGTIYFGVWAKDAKSTTSTFDINNSTTVTVT